MNRIVAPFGPPIDERPPVPTAEERNYEHALYRKAKQERKYLRFHTGRLTSKVKQAEKATEEITKMARMLNLIKGVGVTAASPNTTAPAKNASAKTKGARSTSRNTA